MGFTLEEFRGLTFHDVLDPSEWDRLPGAVAGYADGLVHRAEWTFRRKDGSTFIGELVGGQLPDGWFQSVVRDITERRERETQLQLLMEEAAHRTKNTLSLVQAVARQTAATSPENFLARFEERLAALSASHDILVEAAWKPVALDKLVRAQLSHFASLIGDRIQLEGPPLELASGAVQSLGMALHELTTNASKYGALSTPQGRVAVAWSLEGVGGPQPEFHLSWTESGGPPVAPPNRMGFGTRMIDRVLRRGLTATTDLQFPLDGVTWTLRCPTARIVHAIA